MNIIKRTNYPLMFDEFFNDFFNVKEMNIPPYNIMESEDNFQIEFSKTRISYDYFLKQELSLGRRSACCHGKGSGRERGF